MQGTYRAKWAIWKTRAAQLQDSVDRALWLSDSRLPPDAERVLPIMRQQHPREMGARVSGPDHRAPLCAAHAHSIRFACAELLTSHAISCLSWRGHRWCALCTECAA